jgi:hypothetical protein
MIKTYTNRVRFLYIVFTGLAVCVFAGMGFGQDTVHRPPQAVYAEAGGAGLLFSMNYDARFTKSLDGLGFRVGLGYSFTNDPTFITFPVGVNYLLGRHGNYFEIGANATYVTITNRNNDYLFNLGGQDYDSRTTNLVFGTVNLGYRRQPVHGGFNFRGGITPIFGKGISSIFGYISLGYNF